MAEKRCYTVKDLQEMLDVHKNVFESKEIVGKIRINIASFGKWYANQIKYHKVTGEEPYRSIE